jgi:RimJ/RimL family protein N-acetyltransferase
VRVLEKTGFRHEGAWRRQLLGVAGREDHVWFGLLAEEYQG